MHEWLGVGLTDMERWGWIDERRAGGGEDESGEMRWKGGWMDRWMDGGVRSMWMDGCGEKEGSGQKMADGKKSVRKQHREIDG